MAVIGKKGGKKLPAVSTASLPDIIFTLLFFFMVAAKVKDTSVKVDQTPPKVVDTKKLTSKDKPKTIHVGVPSQAYRDVYGSEPVIQLKGRLVGTDRSSEIQEYVVRGFTETPREQRGNFMINLKADENVPMEVIRLVKEELQKGAATAGADYINVNYNSSSKSY